MRNGLKESDILQAFRDRQFDDEMRWYLRYHARRYACLIAEVEGLSTRLRSSGAGTLRILDVAKSFQTELMRMHVPDSIMDTLGFNDERFTDDPRGKHIHFDLNQAADRGSWPALVGYHIVVIAEVIEHLWAGPVGVLSVLASGLVPGGYLVVQTPNMVALHKRLRMLRGRSPVDPLPENKPGNPHLHEYTVDELVSAGKRAGLTAARVGGSNYFGFGRAATAYARLGRITPLSLRHGLTVTFQKPR